MTDEEFIKLVEAGLDALKPEVQTKLKNVAVVIADEPSALQRAENGLETEDTLFGLYEGVPLIERSIDDHLALPDKITIFKLPILAAYTDPKDIAECVSNTVWHEIAHHFGMEEDEVEREELKRGKWL